MKTIETTLGYFVRVKGTKTSFSADKYSKFFERVKAFQDGQLQGEVYGPEQAKEHINEIRSKQYGPTKYYANMEFEIVKVETIETVVESVPA